MFIMIIIHFVFVAMTANQIMLKLPQISPQNVQIYQNSEGNMA